MAILQRVERLEKAGIILGYSARVNARELGMLFTVSIRLSVHQDHVKELSALLKARSEVSEWYVAPEPTPTFFIKAHFASLERLEKLDDSLAPFGIRHVSLVLSSPVEHRDIGQPM
jgi:DNA-binding Lrp family transcriptional regulator